MKIDFGSFGACRIAVVVALLPLVATSAHAQSGQVALKDGTCAVGADADYICGPINAEELIHLDGTPWVLTSQLGAPFLTEGTIYAVDSKTRQWTEVTVDGDVANLDSETFPNCPGALTAKGFSGHGMTLGHTADGKDRLFAVNHGGREAVEVFDVVRDGDNLPGLTWIGCIPSPEEGYLNTLATLPDGGLVASKFFGAGNPGWFGDMMQGKVTGGVHVWHAGHGWSEVPHSQMSGANGVIADDEGAAIIVAEWGGKKLHRLSLDGSTAPVSVAVNGRPDNIHRAGEKLLVVAQTVADLGPFGACMGSMAEVCGGTFDVLSIDSETLETTLVMSVEADPKNFGFGTSALDLGDEIWVGTTRGNKIAVFSK